MTKDTVTIEVPAGSTVLVNGKEINTKPEFVSRFTHGEYVLTDDGRAFVFPDGINGDKYSRYGKKYLTKLDAGKEAKRRALETRWLTRIAQLNYEHDNWVCDWENEEQSKSCVGSFNHRTNIRKINICSVLQTRSTEHYFCPEAEGQLRKEFTDEEIKTIYFSEIG